MPALTIHPKGNRTRVLLSSVFGPYAQNDEYGSRALNPMELYQNQVTRTQGGFGCVVSGSGGTSDHERKG